MMPSRGRHQSSGPPLWPNRTHVAQNHRIQAYETTYEIGKRGPLGPIGPLTGTRDSRVELGSHRPGAPGEVRRLGFEYRQKSVPRPRSHKLSGDRECPNPESPRWKHQSSDNGQVSVRNFTESRPSCP